MQFRIPIPWWLNGIAQRLLALPKITDEDALITGTARRRIMRGNWGYELTRCIQLPNETDEEFGRRADRELRP